jgi:hypothetical protein
MVSISWKVTEAFSKEHPLRPKSQPRSNQKILRILEQTANTLRNNHWNVRTQGKLRH